MPDSVKVQLSARRDKDNKKDFWIWVKATPVESEAEYIEHIRVLIYQQGEEDNPAALTPYEMQNGVSYGWSMGYNDVFVILVLYRDKRYGEQIAAQGVWWSDGESLRSGRTLQGRSEVFA